MLYTVNSFSLRACSHLTVTKQILITMVIKAYDTDVNYGPIKLATRSYTKLLLTTKHYYIQEDVGEILILYSYRF